MPRCAAAAASAACPTSHSSKSGSAGVSDSSRVGAGLVEHRPLARRRQDRALGERVRLPSAQEDQRGLAVLHSRVVGLNQHGAAVGLQLGRVLARRFGIAETLRTNRSCTDSRFHHDLAPWQPHPLAGREEAARHRRNAGLGEVGEIALVGVPRHHGRSVEQIGHPGRPGQELVEPVDVVPRRPQDHQVSVERVRVVPGQPARVQAALAQRADQSVVVAVALRQRRATGEHDAGMEHVGPGKFHELER